MVFYKCDICGRTVQFAQVMPATLMDADDAMYRGREKVDICMDCMRSISQTVGALRAEAKDKKC